MTLIVRLVGVLALLAVGCASGDGQTDDAQPATTTTVAAEPAVTSAPTTTAAPVATTLPPSTSAPAAPVPSSPDALLAEGFEWGFPLVVSYRTMARFADLLGVNNLFVSGTMAGPGSRIVVAPNRDTIYAVAVLDLQSGPVALSVPDVPDRYHTFQFLDAWTESFAYVGSRATAGRAGTWVVTPPEWEGDLPDDATQIEAGTENVFLLGRFAVDGPDDLDAGRTAASAVRLESLAPGSTRESGFGAPAGAASLAGTNGIEFWDELSLALAANPPVTDRGAQLLAGLEGLGIGPGRTPSTEIEDPELREMMDSAAAGALGRLLDEVSARTSLINGWSVNDTTGRYGEDFTTRAVVSRFGWGANVPEEAVYPVSRQDADGAAYNGSQTYTMRFEPGELPPVDGFWSVSVYGPDMYFVEHPSGRYTIGDRTPDLRVDDDGGLELTLQHTEPADGPTNWLPVPDGPFVLMLRLYLPGTDIVDGRWQPPPVRPAN